MFQCNTLCPNTKCSLCSPLAKGYVPPCIMLCSALLCPSWYNNDIQITKMRQFASCLLKKFKSVNQNRCVMFTSPSNEW